MPIDKSVFISYRRADDSWALAIFNALTQKGYDVFFDYSALKSGDFETVIFENIAARSHFVVLLTPQALDRCNKLDDWLRREVEEAIRQDRNIVPLMLRGFSFEAPNVRARLKGDLAALARYNGLRLHSDYFDEGIARLRERLAVELKSVAHPASPRAKDAARESQDAAREAIQAKPRIDLPPETATSPTVSGDGWFARRVRLDVAIVLALAVAGASHVVPRLLAQPEASEMVTLGKGTVSPSKAVEWFRKAAEQGSAEGQYLYGLSLWLGNGVKRNLSEAFLWFLLAAKQEFAPAILKVGDAYAEGKGVERSDQSALEAYQRASAAGIAEAKAKLGVFYQEGRSPSGYDFAEAYRLFRIAAAMKDPLGCFKLGEFALEDARRGVTKDFVEAKRLMTCAADGGIVAARDALALMEGQK